MSAWDRFTRAGRKLFGGPEVGTPAPEEEPLAEAEPPPAEPEPSPPLFEPSAAASAAPPPPVEPAPFPPDPAVPPETRTRGLSGWVEQRAQRVVRQAYEQHASDLEERAQRAIHSAYEHTADDIEDRAVRAMRRALEAEAGRIKEAIEHAIAVKKREVRLSLLVLVVSSLVYLALYWFTSRPEAP